jgi:hypothetical protein
MNDLARQAANIADGWDVDVTEVAEIIERHGTLVSHEELERLRAYERELEAVSNILTNVHPMGAVKTIGMREAATALGEVLEKQAVSHEDAALLREVKRLENAIRNGSPYSLVDLISFDTDEKRWKVGIDAPRAIYCGGGDTLTAALSSALDAAEVPS